MTACASDTFVEHGRAPGRLPVDKPSHIAREVDVLNNTVNTVVSIGTGDTSENGLETMPSANWSWKMVRPDEWSRWRVWLYSG
jgi:hypothetical protein